MDANGKNEFYHWGEEKGHQIVGSLRSPDRPDKEPYEASFRSVPRRLCAGVHQVRSMAPMKFSRRWTFTPRKFTVHRLSFAFVLLLLACVAMASTSTAAGASSDSSQPAAAGAASSNSKAAETKIFKPLYLSHGGPPTLFDKKDGVHQFLAKFGPKLGKPKAVVIMSAHWEADPVEVTSSTKLIYDFYGFDPKYYKYTYTAPEDPSLAKRVVSMLENANIKAAYNAKRGIDHGTWLPIAVMWPDGDVPVVQLSVKRGLKFEDQAAIGRALAPLVDEGYLLIGSGSSTHNLGAMGELMSNPGKTPSWMSNFEDWLKETLAIDDATERETKLHSVMKTLSPIARMNHPREEHLVPVAFAAAAAGGKGKRIDFSKMMGIMTASQYEFDIVRSKLATPVAKDEL